MQNVCGSSDQARHTTCIRIYIRIYQFDEHNNKFTRTHTELIGNMVEVKIGKYSICEPQLEKINRCEKKPQKTAATTEQEASKRGNTIMNNISKTKCVYARLCMGTLKASNLALFGEK